MPPKGITNTKAFKPPSRTASASDTTSTGPSTKVTESKAKVKAPAKASRPSAMDRFDDDTEDDEDEDDNDDDDETLPAGLATPPRGAKSKNKDKASTSVSTAQSIPADLLRTLLQHHFTDKSTKVGTEASLLVGKYMDTFVREALARAAYERSEADGGDFLEVCCAYEIGGEALCHIADCESGLISC